MRQVGLVDLCNIKIDFKYPINPKTLALIDYLRAGGKMHPIHLQPLPNLPGQFKIRGGRHRWLAAKMLGWRMIPARWSTRFNRSIH